MALTVVFVFVVVFCLVRLYLLIRVTCRVGKLEIHYYTRAELSKAKFTYVFRKSYSEPDLNLMKPEFLSSVQRIPKANLVRGRRERGLTKGIKRGALSASETTLLNYSLMNYFIPIIILIVITVII